MTITHRCSCTRILLEEQDGQLLIKRQGFLYVAEGPILIKCGQCSRWYEITSNCTIAPMTTADVQTRLKERCIQCGTSLIGEDGRTFDICPQCGQPQTLTNTRHNQTR